MAARFARSGGFPFTAFAVIAPDLTWSLDLKYVDGKEHAPGLDLDRMREFCEPAMWKAAKSDKSIEPNLCDVDPKNIGQLPKMLFIIAKHDVLCSPGLKFAKQMRSVADDVTIALANGPHQVKDSAHFAAHGAVTRCIEKFLAGEEINSSFDGELLWDVSKEE